MRLLRRLGRLVGLILAGLVLAPLLALVPAAVADRGPDGAVRGTALYVALAAWDPYVWAGLGNSLAVAAAVTLGALGVGVALAGAVARNRFWGRLPLAALAGASMAVAPLFGAIGLRALFARSGIDPGGRLGWLALVWVELACAAPWVAARAAAAMGRIDPTWEDAARAAGTTRWRAWRDLTWPIVRPEAARAAGTVFALALFEPGAPIVLGLRRTLAFQAVEAAFRPGDAPRAAALALLAVAAAGAGRGLIRLWGRTPPPIPPAALPARPVAAHGPRAAGLALLLVAWGAFALAPLLGLVAAATQLDRDPSGRLHASAAAFRSLVDDPEVRGYALNSLILGGAAGGIALGLAQAVRWPLLQGIPPLAIAIGALMVPGLLEAEADWRRATGGADAPARLLRHAADGLDPFRSPGVLLVWAVATARLPALARASARARRRRRPALIEAARGLGASRPRARRDAAGPRLRSAPGAAWLLAAALAAADSAATLLLAPTARTMTAGPGALLLADDPGGLPRAAALAAAAVAMNLAALAWSARYGGSASDDHP